MDSNEAISRDFLVELFNQTEGDLDRQVSMHDVGAAIGLEKNMAGSLAEELIMEELVELKTLAGGIGITANGMELLEQYGVVSLGKSKTPQLSGKPLLDEDDRKVLTGLLEDIRGAIARADTEYANLEEMVIDVKTIEVQLLSPRPKSAVVMAVLQSLAKTLAEARLESVAASLQAVLNC